MLLIIGGIFMGVAFLIMAIRTSLHPEFLANDGSMLDETIYPILSIGCAFAALVCVIVFAIFMI